MIVAMFCIAVVWGLHDIIGWGWSFILILVAVLQLSGLVQFHAHIQQGQPQRPTYYRGRRRGR